MMNYIPEDRARKLTKALALLPECQTVADILRASDPIDGGAGPMEFNFHANVVQFADLALAGYKPLDPLVLKEQGELGMIQVALLNLGEQPPTPFIIAMHKAGWRVVKGVLTPRPKAPAVEQIELSDFGLDDDGYKDPL